MDAFIGTIFPWPLSWAPQGWNLCDGSLLAINQNQALFALIGITYGGNGSTTFALPNLNCRIPLGAGTAAGLTARVLGAFGGAESAVLAAANLAPHTHAATFAGSSMNVAVQVSPKVATTASPAGNYIGNSYFPGSSDGSVGPVNCISFIPPAGAGTPVTIAGGASGTPSGSVTNAMTGSGLPLPIMDPFLVLSYIICLQGIFPSRP